MKLTDIGSMSASFILMIQYYLVSVPAIYYEYVRYKKKMLSPKKAPHLKRGYDIVFKMSQKKMPASRSCSMQYKFYRNFKTLSYFQSVLLGRFPAGHIIENA